LQDWSRQKRDASEAPTAPLTTSTYLRERQSKWLLAPYSFPSPVEISIIL